MSVPTRSEVAAALVALCDILLCCDAVIGDCEINTQLRSMKNYADTLFSGSDYVKLRDGLVARPQLVEALRNEDMQGVRECLQAEPGRAESIDQALRCAAKVHPTLTADETSALWEEIGLVCDVAA